MAEVFDLSEYIAIPNRVSQIPYTADGFYDSSDEKIAPTYSFSVSFSVALATGIRDYVDSLSGGTLALSSLLSVGSGYTNLVSAFSTSVGLLTTTTVGTSISSVSSSGTSTRTATGVSTSMSVSGISESATSLSVSLSYSLSTSDFTSVYNELNGNSLSLSFSVGLSNA